MRKKKATYREIPTYHACESRKIIHNGTEYKGVMYILSDILTDSQKQKLQDRHSNIVFFISQCEYAPEIKYNSLFVADKNIK